MHVCKLALGLYRTQSPLPTVVFFAYICSPLAVSTCTELAICLVILPSVLPSLLPTQCCAYVVNLYMAVL